MVGVEPEQAADFTGTWETGQRTVGPAPTSIADGLLAPAVGEVNWPVLTKHVDAMETVSEGAIIAAMRLLHESMGLVVEPSGAVAFAGFVGAHKRAAHAGPVVCMVSGGNVDLDRCYALLGP